VFQAHVEWAERFEAQYEPYTHFPNVPDVHRKLRIGYISPDFFVHSVSYFVEALLAHYNRTAFHVTCYSNVVKPDYKTERLRAYVDCWRPIFGMDTKTVASMIRDDQIDILIELTGHTAGNRLDVMAMRPAPIQITYIGYPNTTGMKRIDYRLTDELVDPLDTKQKFTETLIRIPRCFLCYTPAPDVPEVSPLPCLKNAFVTFGSFNNLAKINTKVCEVWATILKAVPNSRLLVKCKPFVSEKVRRKFWDIFERYGVESTRIDLMGLLPIHKDHLSAYGLIDLSLDTWPYAGTTTTCEALYMGVPVITLRNTSPTGCSHAHNVGVSLLTQIGHQRFIANSIEQYIKIAVDLATDIPQLREIRRTLRATMLSSPLCDGPGHTRNVEVIYRRLWAQWCEKQTKLRADSEPNSLSPCSQ
jgi:protein O-GlcNAc transferase